MDNETLVALKESISDWERRARDRGLSLERECPLCALDKKQGRGDCKTCIIMKQTGQSECHSTPFWNKTGVPFPIYEQNEIAFLKSLLPKEKQEGIQQNDIVTIFDGSYSIELKDKLLNPRRNISAGFTYIVLATGLKLPTRQGDGSVNDTIVQEITDRNYIFTQKQFLRLKRRCNYCPKCGDEI